MLMIHFKKCLSKNIKEVLFKENIWVRFCERMSLFSFDHVVLKFPTDYRYVWFAFGFGGPKAQPKGPKAPGHLGQKLILLEYKIESTSLPAFTCLWTKKLLTCHKL